MTNRTRTRAGRLPSFLPMPAGRGLQIARVAVGAALFAATPGLMAGGGPEQTPVAAWATRVWDAARAGKADQLERYFDAVPADGVEQDSLAKFRQSVTQLRSNRDQAMAERDEQRTAALTEMRQEFEAENLAKALRKAVEAQTLSDDFDGSFDDPEVMKLITWAADRVPEMERERYWLDAQELLYMLRTFYEDTSRDGEFQRYDKELEYVNQRVGLIARYVPRRLHDMRNERAERLGEETFGDFNPATAVDWHERLEGVNKTMLIRSLSTAASEHIECQGWRPLVGGGLDALRVMATTSALAETFPALDDPEKVGRWTHYLDDTHKEIAGEADGRLSRGAVSDLLADLLKVNRETVDLPEGVVYREFGDGALQELDTYSEIIWPDKLRRFQQATAGNFVGVGILIRHNDKREIMVVNPLEGTPAYFEGVKPNDLIMEVNGDSTVGWSLNDAVDRITGPKGTVVTLGLRREGMDELIQIPIERDVIKIRSVKGWYKTGLDEAGEPVWDWYLDPDHDIAYIRLTQFTEDSFGDLRQAWREITGDHKPSGLILDLRHNPGGLLTAAVQISNLFVTEGSIVTGEDKDGKQAWGQDARRSYAEFAGMPTAVLINRGSASASEIVAGCLQAHRAAIIVGERSFGKGSVQTIHHVAKDARLKLTTQYYRLPSPDGGITPGRLVHKRPGAKVWGVDPDITVPMSVKQVSDAINLRQAAEIIPLDDEGHLNPDDPERPDVNDLLSKGIDPQLETAVLILSAQALAGEQERHASRQGS